MLGKLWSFRNTMSYHVYMWEKFMYFYSGRKKNRWAKNSLESALFERSKLRKANGILSCQPQYLFFLISFIFPSVSPFSFSLISSSSFSFFLKLVRFLLSHLNLGKQFHPQQFHSLFQENDAKKKRVQHFSRCLCHSGNIRPINSEDKEIRYLFSPNGRNKYIFFRL